MFQSGINILEFLTDKVGARGYACVCISERHVKSEVYVPAMSASQPQWRPLIILISTLPLKNLVEFIDLHHFNDERSLMGRSGGIDGIHCLADSSQGCIAADSGVCHRKIWENISQHDLIELCEDANGTLCNNTTKLDVHQRLTIVNWTDESNDVKVFERLDILLGKFLARYEFF